MALNNVENPTTATPPVQTESQPKDFSNKVRQKHAIRPYDIATDGTYFFTQRGRDGETNQYLPIDINDGTLSALNISEASSRAARRARIGREVNRSMPPIVKTSSDLERLRARAKRMPS